MQEKKDREKHGGTIDMLLQATGETNNLPLVTPRGHDPVGYAKYSFLLPK